MNQALPHADLLATYKRAQADASHKFGLIKAVAGKGPNAIQAAVETRRVRSSKLDPYAEKLAT